MVVEGTVLFASLAAIWFGVLWRRAERRLSRHLRASAATEHELAVARAGARQADEATARLREMLDALPMPVWRHRDGGELVDCNRAYAAAIGSSREAVLAAGTQLVPAGRGGAGAPDRPTAPAFDVHVVIGGERRLLEVNEARLKSQARGPAAKGSALPATGPTSKTPSASCVGTSAPMPRCLKACPPRSPSLDRTNGSDFFNTAFTGLWGLDADWLGSEPTLGDILDRLHELRRFPEYSDFRAFKRERCELFTSLIEPGHELMHLPDGRTLQLTVSPHPRGGLTYVYDDVSDRLALERSYNTLAQVQRATLDHLFEGIAVYGGDGRLKLHNPAFRALWGLSEADVASEPHIGEIVDKIRSLLDDRDDWARVREGDGRPGDDPNPGKRPALSP